MTITTEAPVTATPITWRKARSIYAGHVRDYGRDSEKAKAAEQVYWTVRLCALIANAVDSYALTDEQRQAIANTALTAGR